VASRLITRPVRLAALISAAVVSLLVVPASVGQAAPIPSAADAQRTISQLQDRVDRATEDYDNARVALARSQDREKRLRAEQATQQLRVDGLQAQVAEFAAAAYRRGRVDVVSSLLQSGSPQMFLDEMSTLDNLSRDQRAQLDQLVAARRVLTQQKRTVDAELATQRKTESTLQAHKVAIEKDLATWQALKARADALARARASRATRTAAPPRRRAATSARSTAATHSAAPVGGYAGSASGSAAVALRTAYAQLGKPYQWGAAGPGSFDCSGLMMYSWAAAGVSLPHSSGAQYGSGQHVSRSALRPGDLVFFGSPIYHVGMYVGGGMMIHAPTTGDVVRIAPILSDFVGATRP